MRGLVRGAMALATVAMLAPAPAAAQAEAKKPVVAVLYFDNNSIGRDRADYDGVGKGIADLLVTDMAANPNVQVVERERIQALLVEQNLTRQGSIDPQTAIRLGKIIGAQYMITGGFLSNNSKSYVLTARAVNVETGVISNPVRLNFRGDDVLAMITSLTEKINSEMKLPALQVGMGGGGAAPAAAMPAGQPAPEAAKPAQAQAAPSQAAPAQGGAAAAPKAAKPKAQPKIDIRTAMLYSKALEEEDAGNRTKAVELYRQVVDKFPDFAPAKDKLAKLSRS